MSECLGVITEPTWLCKDGRLLALREMTDQHLINTYAFLERLVLADEEEIAEVEGEWHDEDFEYSMRGELQQRAVRRREKMQEIKTELAKRDIRP